MGDDILEETEEEFLAGGRRLVKLLTVTCSSNLTHFDILQQWKKQTKKALNVILFAEVGRLSFQMTQNTQLLKYYK